MPAVDGPHLRWCREKSGYTVAQFAKELGISEDYLRNIENGARGLKRRPDLVKRAADILEVPQQKLFQQVSGGGAA